MIYCTAGEKKTFDFLNYRENGSPQAFAEDRKNFFLPGDDVCAQESDAAGGLTNIGPDRKRPVRFPHAIGGEGKVGGQPQGFLGGQLRQHKEGILLSG